MATKLDKSIKRELDHAGKAYTVTISPEGVKVVEKGKRNGIELSWNKIIGTGDGAAAAGSTGPSGMGGGMSAPR